MPSEKGAADLLEFLKREGVEAELLEFSSTVRTVDDAVRASGVEAAGIIKTLVVLCDSEPACLVVPGDRRLSFAKVRRALDCKDVRLAKPAEVLAFTGYSIGGVPPVGHGLRTIVDRAVLGRDVVVGGGGDDRHLLKIAPSEIVRLTGAKVADVSE